MKFSLCALRNTGGYLLGCHAPDTILLGLGFLLLSSSAFAQPQMAVIPFENLSGIRVASIEIMPLIEKTVSQKGYQILRKKSSKNFWLRKEFDSLTPFLLLSPKNWLEDLACKQSSPGPFFPMYLVSIHRSDFQQGSSQKRVISYGVRRSVSPGRI